MCIESTGVAWSVRRLDRPSQDEAICHHKTKELDAQAESVGFASGTARTGELLWTMAFTRRTVLKN